MEQWWPLMCPHVSNGLFLTLSEVTRVHFSQPLAGVSSHFFVCLPRICSVWSFHFLTLSLALVSLVDIEIGIMEDKSGMGVVLVLEPPSGEKQALGELTQSERL